MKKITFIIASVLINCHSAFSQADTDTKLTLKQCIETGIANNLQVQQSKLQVRADEINWKQSKLNMLPDLNAFASHGINQGRSIDPFTNSYINQEVNFASYGVNSGIILFNGFSMQNTVKQNKLTYQASQMDLQQEEDNLTFNIILAFLRVLNSEDLLEQSKNQAELSKKQVERLEVLNKEGAIAPSELSDLKGQYANDQLSIINAQNTLESSKIFLCQLMNIPYDRNMTLERLDASSFAEKYADTPDKIYQTALQEFAQIKAVDLRYQSAEKRVRAISGTLFPTLSFNGRANTNYSSAASQSTFINTTDVVSNDYVIVNGNPTPVIRKQNNFKSEKINYNNQLNNNLYNTFSLDLRVPLFNSLLVRNRVRLARIDLKSSELAAQTAKTQLQQAIGQAYVNMTSASDRYKTVLEQVDAFSESFRAAEIRFNSGVGNTIDYLTAKNNLDRANINLINAKYDFVLRTKILDYYQGKQLW